ncbi:hypothetical protein N9B24_00025 [bacterium]|nr:hypothetical protein [bacterium]
MGNWLFSCKGSQLIWGQKGPGKSRKCLVEARFVTLEFAGESVNQPSAVAVAGDAGLPIPAAGDSMTG